LRQVFGERVVVAGFVTETAWRQAQRYVRRRFIGSTETSSGCGGAVKVIASIEDPVVIRKILAHLDEKAALAGSHLLPQCRAPPRTGLFEETGHSNTRLH